MIVYHPYHLFIPAGEVNFHGEKLLIVKGGIGGGPWNNFCGQKGVSLHVRLDLKLIADIGLVGYVCYLIFILLR